jgi:hypothetical protein
MDEEIYRLRTRAFFLRATGSAFSKARWEAVRLRPLVEAAETDMIVGWMYGYNLVMGVALLILFTNLSALAFCSMGSTNRIYL